MLNCFLFFVFFVRRPHHRDSSSDSSLAKSKNTFGSGGAKGAGRNSSGSSSTSTSGGRGSRAVDGSILGDIHEENLSRVSAMSADEVAEAQQEIRSALSPAALEMFMRRGRAKESKAVLGGGKGEERERRAVPAAGAAGGGAEAAGSGMIGVGVVEGGERSSSGRETRRITGGADETDRGSSKEDDEEGGGEEMLAETDGIVLVGRGGGGVNEEDRQHGSSVVVRGGLAAGAKEPDLRTGAPTGAQRAATAVGGVDSEEALEAALRSLPPDERAKSSWTLSGSVDAADGGGQGGGRGEARVDLDGAVVVGATEGDGELLVRDGRDGRALHHHGDDPGEAGYTPSELLQLARWGLFCESAYE